MKLVRMRRCSQPGILRYGSTNLCPRVVPWKERETDRDRCNSRHRHISNWFKATGDETNGLLTSGKSKALSRFSLLCLLVFPPTNSTITHNDNVLGSEPRYPTKYWIGHFNRVESTEKVIKRMRITNQGNLLLLRR